MSKRNESDAIFNNKRVAIVSVLGAVGLFTFISLGGETFLEGVVTNSGNGNTAPLICNSEGVGPGVQPDCCGDGVKQTANAEQCDQGVANGPTGPCTGSCQPLCGDGVIYANEECDNGAANDDTAECTTSCKNAVCGDGHTQIGVEECDDGTSPDDGCSDICELECLEDITELELAVVDAQIAYDAANQTYLASRAAVVTSNVEVGSADLAAIIALENLDIAKFARSDALTTANNAAALAQAARTTLDTLNTEAQTAIGEHTNALNELNAANLEVQNAGAIWRAARDYFYSVNNHPARLAANAKAAISRAKDAAAAAKDAIENTKFAAMNTKTAAASAQRIITENKRIAAAAALNDWTAANDNVLLLEVIFEEKRILLEGELNILTQNNQAQQDNYAALLVARANNIAAQLALDTALALPECTDESNLPPGEPLIIEEIIAPEPATIAPLSPITVPSPDVNAEETVPLPDLEPEGDPLDEENNDDIPPSAVGDTGDAGDTGDSGDGPGFWGSLFGPEDPEDPSASPPAPEPCEWFEFWCE